MARIYRFPGSPEPAESLRAESDTTQLIAFTSTCPRCRREQMQPGLSRTALHGLLSEGQPIEAYCVMCDQFWPVDLKTRIQLAWLVAKSLDFPAAPHGRPPKFDGVPAPASCEPPRYEPLPFTSTCPRCLEERAQRGYSRAMLRRQLQGQRAIEAYCVACDEFWPLSAGERATLVRHLAD